MQRFYTTDDSKRQVLQFANKIKKNIRNQIAHIDLLEFGSDLCQRNSKRRCVRFPYLPWTAELL